MSITTENFYALPKISAKPMKIWQKTKNQIQKERELIRVSEHRNYRHEERISIYSGDVHIGYIRWVCRSVDKLNGHWCAYVFASDAWYTAVSDNGGIFGDAFGFCEISFFDDHDIFDANCSTKKNIIGWDYAHDHELKKHISIFEAWKAVTETWIFMKFNSAK